MKIIIDECVNKIKNKLHNGSDLRERRVQFFSTDISLVYFPALTEPAIINNYIVRPLLEYDGKTNNNIIDLVVEHILCNAEVVVTEDESEMITNILKGFVAILIDGGTKYICVNAEKIVVRAIDIPPQSTVVKGPRQGFNESLKYNLSLLRQRLVSEKLIVKSMTLGKYTQTQVAICYIDDIVDKDIVEEVEEKLKKINVDGILDSSYISAFLQRKPNSLFKQIGDTEKPDILAGKLLEGRLGIIVDGSPIVLTLPFILTEDLQSEDDYYSQHLRVSFIRILRAVGIVLAVLLPGIYVALQIYHYKIIPLEFLLTIMNTTQGIPFTPFTELLFVILLFEILYEANLRMPQYLGMALSIVGALILGETAVNAGLVSPPSVMIVALSGLTFYSVPNQAGQLSMLRLLFLVLGTVLGIFGIILGCVGVLSYMSSFDSYKSAYLAPFTPFINDDQKDFFLKDGQENMKTRPKSIANNRKNMIRQNTPMKTKINQQSKKQNKK